MHHVFLPFFFHFFPLLPPLLCPWAENGEVGSSEERQILVWHWVTSFCSHTHSLHVLVCVCMCCASLYWWKTLWADSRLKLLMKPLNYLADFNEHKWAWENRGGMNYMWWTNHWTLNGNISRSEVRLEWCHYYVL